MTEFSKKENVEVNTNNAFPVPATAEEADEIIKKVLRIVYPNGEGIKNKRTLIHVMKKKLMNGQLEMPEGWQDLQKKKKETANHNQESQKIADGINFQKAKEEFAKLPENEQKKYLDAARRTANSVASARFNSSVCCNPTGGKREKGGIIYDGTGISIGNGSE